MTSWRYLIGVDGGGSGTRATVQRADGLLLGRGQAGPSALGQGVDQAWRNVEAAIANAFADAGVARPPRDACALAAGLSGASHGPWREAFEDADPGYGRLEVETDAFTMLLGAHGGKPGAIVIAGTGSVAEALQADGSRETTGGWGFPVGDEGSGAWLGWEAVRHAQAVLDGRANIGPLARAVCLHCGDDRASMQAWCGGAGQFAYARLARAVFDAEATDPVAAHLLIRATHALEDLALAVDPRGRLPLVLAGSVGERLAQRLRPALRARLAVPRGDAVSGALMLLTREARPVAHEAA